MVEAVDLREETAGGQQDNNVGKETKIWFQLCGCKVISGGQSSESEGDGKRIRARGKSPSSKSS